MLVLSNFESLRTLLKLLKREMEISLVEERPHTHTHTCISLSLSLSLSIYICGSERSAIRPKLYLGLGPVPRGYLAEDE